VLSEIEQAFAENLILMGAAPGVHVIGLLHRREQDPRPLWDLARELRVAPDAALLEAKQLADVALAAAGPQAFSFSEGAMVGPWELLEVRGQGVGGECWSARLSTNTQQAATVRLLPPATGDDPGRRLRWVERSNPGLEPPHPSILKIDEADEDFGWLYTATIGFDGRSVQALRASALPEPSALALAQSVAGSLSVVHELGVVHGGVNPLGVLVSGQRTYLSDFGVSSTVLDGPVEGCRPGGRLAAALYSSPGLVRGDAARGLDARDDLYALGALVYWAVCSAAPDEGRAAPTAPWLFEPRVSAGLRTILTRLLSSNLDGCYPTARALVADLAKVAAGGAPGGLPPLAGPPVRGRRAATAVPQQPVRPRPATPTPTPSAAPRLAAPTPDDVDPPSQEPEEPAQAQAAPAAPRKQKVSERMKRPSERLKKGKSQANLPAPRKRTWGESAGAQAKTDSGWLVFAACLVLVVGGLFGVKLVSQPQGKELGRVRLAQAERLLRAKPAMYAEALAAIDEAVPTLASDPAALGAALARRDDVLARAAAERLALLPAGLDAAPDAIKAVEQELRDLQLRATGLPAATLVGLDLARSRETVDARTWIDLGTELIAHGEPAAAVLATQKSGRAVERQFAEQASASLAFLAGGPYLAPNATGEGLQLVTREPLYVARHEVNRADYRRFLVGLTHLEKPHSTCDPNEPADKDHRPEGWAVEAGPDGALPATGVDLWDAVAYARWRGGELPDLATLTAAARGRAGRRFPWGERPPSLGVANTGGHLGALAPGGCFAAGAGAGGALDLVGNAEEWAAPSSVDARSAPVFGGHFGTPDADVAASAPREAPFDERRPERGFRMARKLPLP
jgi:formylglycine-generating enzyme required for sulfatase activity